MEDSFTITFPKTTSKNDVKAIKDTLVQLNAVEDMVALNARSVDPASIAVLVELVSGSLVAISTAVPLVKKVVETIRSKKIKGVTIKFPNGMEISVDKASVAEIQQLLQVAAQS